LQTFEQEEDEPEASPEEREDYLRLKREKEMLFKNLFD